MTTLFTRAPGKLVLLGDYAVLDGAPALALAVNRYARVRLDTENSGKVTICADDLGIPVAHAAIGTDGGLHWPPGSVAERHLDLVAHIWNTLAAENLAPESGVRLTLDTSGFFDSRQGGLRKLGLGSSAALTVALAAALTASRAHPDDNVPNADGPGLPPLAGEAWLTRLVNLHRAWQGRQGSGIDIAASLAGGLISYHQGDAATPPALAHEAWPPAGVHCLFVWSGEAVSTARSLVHLGIWRQKHPADYRASMDELHSLANTLPAVLAAGPQDFVALVAAYADALDRFARASSLEIFSPQQKVLAHLVAHEGASFKPCGAGGDFGVVVAASADALARVHARITQAGLQPVPLSIAPQGAQYGPSADTPPSRSQIGR